MAHLTSPARPSEGALPQGLAELGPFAPSKPAQAGLEPRHSPIRDGRGTEFARVHS
jgi:hypothetical protein